MEKIGKMNGARRFASNQAHEPRMRVSKSIDGDASQEIEILAPVCVVKAASASAREFARRKRTFEMKFSFSPLLTHCSLRHSRCGMDCGKNAGTEPARAVRRGEQGTGDCASDDVHFAHAAGQSSFRGFKLQNHSA